MIIVSLFMLYVALTSGGNPTFECSGRNCCMSSLPCCPGSGLGNPCLSNLWVHLYVDSGFFINYVAYNMFLAQDADATTACHERACNMQRGRDT